MLAPSFAMMPSKLNVGIAKNELIVRVAPSMDYQVLSLPLNELVVRFRPFDGQPYSNPKPYSQAPPLEASSEKWRSLMFRDHELRYCTMLDVTAEKAVEVKDGQILGKASNPQPCLSPRLLDQTPNPKP